ncbi:MAG: LCP family protein, partial [Pseudonocardia sp.]|nr:LCP family protein [Pseudonocardia sp.]
LMLHRRRTGGLILGAYLAGIVVLVVLLLTLRRSALLATALSPQFLAVAAAALVLAACAWVGVIVRTWMIAQPRGLDSGRRSVGIAAVTVLSLVVAAPLGYAANLANSQRTLIGDLFTEEDATVALGQDRLNLLLVGSDAGPDRTGTRTDTMIVASIETATGRTTLFSLPRNIGRAQFPPDSRMGEEFPDGFHDDDDPASGNYLLNAVYAYGYEFPQLAPSTPTDDPGLNLLHQTVSYMLGLQLDYFVELNMAGFAAIVDALGGVEVDVGPERVPIGGISPSGRAVEPTGYIEPGIQQLGGEDALAFARSRTNSTDYVRMGRQRCLLQSILSQNAPTDLLANFQAIAKATTDSVSTDIPQGILPALVSLADGPLELESVAFDPNLPDPEQSDGRFDTGNPDFAYMREVVQDALARDPAVTPPVVAAAPSDIPETNENPEDAEDSDTSATSGAEETSEAPLTTTPVSVAQSC